MLQLGIIGLCPPTACSVRNSPNAVKYFSKAFGGVKSVEQLSQLFTAGHASGLERKHLGHMFYGKSFTALEKLPEVASTGQGSQAQTARIQVRPLTWSTLFQMASDQAETIRYLSSPKGRGESNCARQNS